MSRARGEVETRSGTCRSRQSWCVWLAGFCDAACPRCRDPASPRGPAPAAAAAGERASPHGSQSPRIPPGRSWVPREAGGTGRGQSLSQRPAALRSSRRLASSSSPGFPPAQGAALAHGPLQTERVPRRAPRTDGWTQTQQCRTCIPAQAQVQSHLLRSVPPCPRGRSRSRPTPTTLRTPGREPQSREGK